VQEMLEASNNLIFDLKSARSCYHVYLFTKEILLLYDDKIAHFFMS